MNQPPDWYLQNLRAKQENDAMLERGQALSKEAIAAKDLSKALLGLALCRRHFECEQVRLNNLYWLMQFHKVDSIPDEWAIAADGGAA